MQPGTRDDLRYAVVRCCIPGPGYIGMCKVFPRASDLQGFSKINGYAWSSCFRGWGGGGGGGGKGRRRRNSSGGCHCSAQPLDNANTPYSEAGWREARATNENSTEFETVRASDTYISREKRTRLCIEKGIDETNIYICVYTCIRIRCAQQGVINNSWEPWSVTGWHLWYTVRKLIRYCFKAREDNPNDLVSSCRNSSHRIGGFPRLGFDAFSGQNWNAEIQFSLPMITTINMLKITRSCATDSWGERARTWRVRI